MISNAKQKEAAIANNRPSSQSQPTPLGSSSQRVDHHGQYEGSNTFNRTKSLPPNLPHHRHLPEGEKSRTLAAVRGTHVTSAPKSMASVRASGTEKGTFSTIGTGSSGERVHTSSKTTMQTKHPSLRVRQSKASLTGVVDLHPVNTLSANVQLPQFGRNQLAAPKTGLQGLGKDLPLVGQSSSSSGAQQPARSARFPASARSSHKEQLAVKTAEVLNKLNALKSTVAELAEAKRNKKIAGCASSTLTRKTTRSTSSSTLAQKTTSSTSTLALKTASSTLAQKTTSTASSSTLAQKTTSCTSSTLAQKTASTASSTLTQKTSSSTSTSTLAQKTASSTLAQKTNTSSTPAQKNTSSTSTSTLADKSGSSDTKFSPCNTPSHSGNQTVASGKIKAENEMKKSEGMKMGMAAFDCRLEASEQSLAAKTERAASSPKYTVLKCFNKPVMEETLGRTRCMVNKSTHSSPNTLGQAAESAHPLSTPSASWEPSSRTATSIATQTDSEVFLREKGTGGSSSPSKSSARASLERELKATQEKLVSMREKMGVMLKESPKKMPPAHQNRVSVPHVRTNNVDISSLSVSAAIHSHSARGENAATDHGPTRGSPSAFAATAERRPFPNCRSLKWTPQKGPIPKASERVLVVGGSPSLRSFQCTSSKGGSPAPNLPDARRNHSVNAHITAMKNFANAKIKKSRYSLVKTNHGSTAVSRLRDSTSQAAISLTPRKLHRHAVKPFVGRYKLQRLNSDSPKASKSGRNLQGKITLKSRYKLMKSHSQPTLSGLSAHQTAILRAARVIKSKYKMRKVPIHISPSKTAASFFQSDGVNQHFVQHQMLVRNPQNAQPYAWKTRASKYSRLSVSHSSSRYSFQSSSSFPPTAATRNPFRGSRHRRGRTNAAYFYGGSWDRRPEPYQSSSWWWTQQHQRRNFFPQQSLRHRAKAIMGWCIDLCFLFSPDYGLISSVP